MKLTIAKSILSDAATRAATIADGKGGSPPICAFARLRATAGKLTLTSTDLNVTSIANMPASVKDTGSLLVEAKRFAQVIGALPAGDVSLTIDGNFLVVKGGKSTSRINGQPDRDYPAVPNPAEAAFAACSPTSLAAMFARAMPAVSLDETRGAMAGVLLEMSATTARMVATDGSRLVRTDCDLGLPARSPVVIPLRGAKALREAIKDADGCELAFAGSVMMAKVGDTTIAVKLMDFAFLPYGAVVDAALKNKSRTVVSRAALSESLARAQIMIQKDDKESAHGVKLTIAEDGILIHAIHPDHGDTREEVEAALTGEPVTLGVQPRFFRAALSALDADEVTVTTSGPLDAFVVRGSSDATITIIMPMRV